jgi:hypothetical protein
MTPTFEDIREGKGVVGGAEEADVGVGVRVM